MKIITVFLFFLFSSFCFAQCDTIAPLNKGILSFTASKMNKKVGTGECWDLAKLALEEVDAKWDKDYVYGRKLKSNECVLAGDIIQFEKIKVKYKKENQTFTEDMPHHTAIIYEVKNKDEVILAHQNTFHSGKKVGTSTLRFSTIISGKYFIYRPQK